MAHISAGLEYGLHCLLFLVDPRRDVPPASARDLAELQGVSVEYVAKLFTKLQKADLVVATEGVGGGFRLARAADSISVLDVVTAIDGEEAAVRLPRDPRPVRAVRRQAARMGDARRLLDTRHHAGGGDANARGVGVAHPSRPRGTRGREGAA